MTMSGKVDTTVDPSLLEIDGEDPTKTADAILKALIERRSYPGAKYKEGGATLAAAVRDWISLEVDRFIQNRGGKAQKRITAKSVFTLRDSASDMAIDVRLTVQPPKGKQEVLNLAVRIQIACGSDGNPSLLQLKIYNDDTYKWVHVAIGRVWNSTGSGKSPWFTVKTTGNLQCH
jgi:hypothetical protein